jgi:hypothetical protein
MLINAVFKPKKHYRPNVRIMHLNGRNHAEIVQIGPHTYPYRWVWAYLSETIRIHQQQPKFRAKILL